MAIVTVGIDLAKNVFAVHGINEAGKPELVRPSVARDKRHELIAALPPCVIGMEACSGAHHWARLASEIVVLPWMMSRTRAVLRLAVQRLMSSSIGVLIVISFNVNTCAGIYWVNTFVPMKSLVQQSQLMLHRARQGFVEQRTATINRIRGLLSEFGIVLPLKAATVRRRACECLEDLPGWANTVVGDLLSEVSHLDERVTQYDQHIRQEARSDARAKRLMQLGGVGETTATCLLAMIGNGHEFDCGRQFAAWLGLVPGQYSSGGKARLGRITKAGDPYLRSLLVMGARAVLAAAKNKTDPVSRWALAVHRRRGYWKAVVAIAAKNARMAWAVLRRGEDFALVFIVAA